MAEKISSRINSLGLQGRTGVSTNTKDSFIKTYEFPITIVASTSAQSLGVVAPKSVQAISAYIIVDAAEVTGATKTVSVGVVGAAASFLSAIDVSSTGAVGTPVTAALDNTAGATFAYTLGSADFAELDATVVLTVQGSDS